MFLIFFAIIISKIGYNSLTSIISKDEESAYSNVEPNGEEKESSMGWHIANGHMKDPYVNGNADSLEILLEQLRNAQDDIEACQYLEAVVRLLDNQKVRISDKYFKSYE